MSHPIYVRSTMGEAVPRSSGRGILPLDSWCWHSATVRLPRGLEFRYRFRAFDSGTRFLGLHVGYDGRCRPAYDWAMGFDFALCWWQLTLGVVASAD